MDGYIKKSEAVDVIVKYPYDIAGKTATAIKMIEDLPSADVVPKSEYDAVVSAVDNSTKEFLKLHDDYQKAKSEVEKLVQDGTRLVQENETLKDNNEHLAVILEEAKSEVERLQAEKDALIKNYAECMKDYASEIFVEIEKMLDGIMIVANPNDGFITTFRKTMDKVTAGVAELKKKYTEVEGTN